MPNFKIGPEVAFGVLVAVVAYLSDSLMNTDPATVQDWTAFAKAIAVGATRAGAVAFLLSLQKILSHLKGSSNGD